MNKKAPKPLRTYYILYRVERDTDTEQIIDLQNVWEFTNKQDIASYIHASKRDILAMINEHFTDNLKTFKNYSIIQYKEHC